VMPHFQGSLTNLKSSQKWVESHREELLDLRNKSLDQAMKSFTSKK